MEEFEVIDDIQDRAIVTPIIDEPKEESPVYIEKEAKDDILALNDLRKEQERLVAEKDTKEADVKDIESQKSELDEKIGIINNGNHINEVALNLKDLRELNEKLENAKASLEETYGNLRKVEEDIKNLEATTRRMVSEFTREYNRKVETYVALVDRYRESGNESDYEEANRVVDELNNFVKYNTFEDILKDKEYKEEEVKEEVSEETKTEEVPTEEQEVEETKIEETPVVEQEEPKVELSEVKVDTIPAEPKVEDIPAVEQKVEEPKIEETPVVEQKEEVSEDIPSFGSIEEEPVVKAEITPLLIDKTGKIADSTKAGEEATINAFNPNKVKAEVTDMPVQNEPTMENVAILTKRPGSTEPKVA